jgi:hypothetical protein
VSDPPHDPRDDELEELSGDVILAQESTVHSPQRRTQVATDAPSVVISEPPVSGRGAHMPTTRTRARRESSEQTVVIRDRRQLDKMRKAMSERPRSKQKKPLIEAKTIYLLAAAAVGSLVVGTLIAALVDGQNDSELEPLPSVPSAVAAPTASTDARSDQPDTIDLDSLPVDNKTKRRVSR